MAAPPGSLVICLASEPSAFAVKIWPSPATARVKAIRPLNFAVGVAVLEGAEPGPVPALFVASTLNVYPVPLVRPGTVAAVCDAGTVTEAPPGDAVTV